MTILPSSIVLSLLSKLAGCRRHLAVKTWKRLELDNKTALEWKRTLMILGLKLFWCTTEEENAIYFSPLDFANSLLSSTKSYWILGKTHGWAPNLPRVTWTARQSLFCSMLPIFTSCHVVKSHSETVDVHIHFACRTQANYYLSFKP